MPLHDTVGMNCKKGATTENQGAGVKLVCIWAKAKGCMLMIVCASDLDYLFLVEGESHGILLL